MTGRKGYIPYYGWFGTVGRAVEEWPGFVWFEPAHTPGAFKVNEKFIEPYEWADSWELWMGKHDERYGGKWFHSSNYWGIYGSNRGRNTPDRSRTVQGEV